MKMNKNLKKILGILLVVFVLLLTIKFIKVLPAIIKVMALAGNIATIYLVYDLFTKNKNKKKDGTEKSS